MKIAFVVPNMFKTRAFDAIEPLVFAILAARTPDDVEVVAWHLQPDGVCEKVHFEQRETELFSYFDTRSSGVRTRVKHA